MILDLEHSRQEIPLTQETDGVLAQSVPLHELEGQAPPLSTLFDLEAVKYTFSNDESAAYFDQMQARTSTPEYQQATNRVAILIGESSLMSTIRFIPEETIILLDRSADMCGFMKSYVEKLRGADTIDGWLDSMGLGLPLSDKDIVHRMALRLVDQAREWRESGYIHATADVSGDIYKEAQRLAREKAIIPWRGDITSYSDMRKLGAALEAQDAHVTIMNLTNVLIQGDFDDTADCVDRISQLPVTSNAPILTTTFRGKSAKTGDTDGITVQATGPFFGLENLRQHGGSLVPGTDLGTAIERKYFESDDSDFDRFILQALGGQNGVRVLLAAQPQLTIREAPESNILIVSSSHPCKALDPVDIPPEVYLIVDRLNSILNDQ